MLSDELFAETLGGVGLAVALIEQLSANASIRSAQKIRVFVAGPFAATPIRPQRNTPWRRSRP